MTKKSNSKSKTAQKFKSKSNLTPPFSTLSHKLLTQPMNLCSMGKIELERHSELKASKWIYVFQIVAFFAGNHVKNVICIEIIDFHH